MTQLNCSFNLTLVTLQTVTQQLIVSLVLCTFIWPLNYKNYDKLYKTLSTINNMSVV